MHIDKNTEKNKERAKHNCAHFCGLLRKAELYFIMLQNGRQVIHTTPWTLPRHGRRAALLHAPQIFRLWHTPVLVTRIRAREYTVDYFNQVHSTRLDNKC